MGRPEEPAAQALQQDATAGPSDDQPPAYDQAHAPAYVHEEEQVNHNETIMKQWNLHNYQNVIQLVQMQIANNSTDSPLKKSILHLLAGIASSFAGKFYMSQDMLAFCLSNVLSHNPSDWDRPMTSLIATTAHWLGDICLQTNHFGSCLTAWIFAAKTLYNYIQSGILEPSDINELALYGLLADIKTLIESKPDLREAGTSRTDFLPFVDMTELTTTDLPRLLQHLDGTDIGVMKEYRSKTAAAESPLRQFMLAPYNLEYPASILEIKSFRFDSLLSVHNVLKSVNAAAADEQARAKPRKVGPTDSIETAWIGSKITPAEIKNEIIARFRAQRIEKSALIPRSDFTIDVLMPVEISFGLSSMGWFTVEVVRSPLPLTSKLGLYVSFQRGTMSRVPTHPNGTPDQRGQAANEKRLTYLVESLFKSKAPATSARERSPSSDSASSNAVDPSPNQTTQQAQSISTPRKQGVSKYEKFWVQAYNTNVDMLTINVFYK